jgi:hypothetical protein
MNRRDQEEISGVGSAFFFPEIRKPRRMGWHACVFRGWLAFATILLVDALHATAVLDIHSDFLI